MNHLCISTDIDIFTESTMWKQVIVNQMMLKMITCTNKECPFYRLKLNQQRNPMVQFHFFKESINVTLSQSFVLSSDGQLI